MKKKPFPKDESDIEYEEELKAVYRTSILDREDREQVFKIRDNR
jgi:hypothetical protein